MLFKKFVFLITALLVFLLIASACVPGNTTSSGADQNPNQAQNGGEVEQPGINQSQGGGAAPNAGAGQEEQGGGQDSNPGGGEGETNPMGDQQKASGKLTEYADKDYKFRVSYPDNFVFRRLPAENLASLQPKPEASFTITNPKLAADEQAGIGPADLEIRSYPAAGQANLETWLTTAKLLAADVKGKPFKTEHVSGLEVCASTMIAPGCSYFFMGNGWIYQLTPASIEGESMIKSFIITK